MPKLPEPQPLAAIIAALAARAERDPAPKPITTAPVRRYPCYFWHPCQLALPLCTHELDDTATPGIDTLTTLPPAHKIPPRAGAGL